MVVCVSAGALSVPLARATPLLSHHGDFKLAAFAGIIGAGVSVEQLAIVVHHGGGGGGGGGSGGCCCCGHHGQRDRRGSTQRAEKALGSQLLPGLGGMAATPAAVAQPHSFSNIVPEQT